MSQQGQRGHWQVALSFPWNLLAGAVLEPGFHLWLGHDSHL